MSPDDVEALELHYLLDAIFVRYGYDFRKYAKSSLTRRVRFRMELAGLRRISEMLPRVLHDPEFFDTFLRDLSVTVTHTFRDPNFYRKFREEVIPHLRGYPTLKIWHAGCATGEEVYSMAILLHEEGLLERATIYATDYNKQSLRCAAQGMYELEALEHHAKNYQLAGGKAEFSDYYDERYGSARMKKFLRDKITVSFHNLVQDRSFGEMQVVCCRNVLIYFNRELQNQVLGLFRDSLCSRGFLCLGSKETAETSETAESFKVFARKQKIYRLHSAAASRGAA